MRFRKIFEVPAAYFFRGLLVTVPLVVTVYVIVQLFLLIDGLFVEYVPVEIPGLRVVLLIVLITALGFLGSSVIAQPFNIYFRRLLKRAPLIKTIYTSVKDLVSAFVGQKKRFNQPVLVRLSVDTDVQKLGFLTSSDLEELGINKGMVAVYLPHSYAFSGNLFVVPAENVTPLDAKAADVMKFIISGGVTEIDQDTLTEE